MAITTMDGLVSAIATGRVVPFYKSSTTAKAAASFQDLFLTGGNPGAGTANATLAGANCTNTTPGAMSIQTPGGANKLYLAKIAMSNATIGTLIIYDRLWANGGFTITSTGSQTFTPPSIARYTDGIGVEAWLETYTAVTNAVTATLAYTDISLGSVNATATTVAASAAGQMFPFILPAGGRGVSTCSGVTLNTSGAAGTIGVVLLKRLCEVPVMVANIGTNYDTFSIGMPEVASGACLAGMVMTSATSTGIITGSIVIAEG